MKYNANYSCLSIIIGNAVYTDKNKVHLMSTKTKINTIGKNYE